jgi:hypothetical protein
MQHQLLLSPCPKLQSFLQLHKAYPRSSCVRSETSNKCLSSLTSHRTGHCDWDLIEELAARCNLQCSGKRLTRVRCSGGKPLAPAGRVYRVSADRHHCSRRVGQCRAETGCCSSSNPAADSRLCEVSIFLVHQCDRRSLRVQSGRPKSPHFVALSREDASVKNAMMEGD